MLVTGRHAVGRSLAAGTSRMGSCVTAVIFDEAFGVPEPVKGVQASGAPGEPDALEDAPERSPITSMAVPPMSAPKTGRGQSLRDAEAWDLLRLGTSGAMWRGPVIARAGALFRCVV